MAGKISLQKTWYYYVFDSRMEKRGAKDPFRLDTIIRWRWRFLGVYVSRASAEQEIGERRERGSTALTFLILFNYYLLFLFSIKRLVVSATRAVFHFIHECGARSRVEDVVVDGAQHRFSLGALLNGVLLGWRDAWASISIR